MRCTTTENGIDISDDDEDGYCIPNHIYVVTVEDAQYLIKVLEAFIANKEENQ